MIIKLPRSTDCYYEFKEWLEEKGNIVQDTYPGRAEINGKQIATDRQAEKVYAYMLRCFHQSKIKNAKMASVNYKTTLKDIKS